MANDTRLGTLISCSRWLTLKRRKAPRKVALDALVEIATKHDNFFVQSAAVAAIGYVSSAEDYPRRHLMARGFDYMLNEHWGVNFDVRRIWINTDVTISGDINATDEVDINPWVVSTSIAYRF